ncbi:hypothetical protein [Rhodobium gokarnense]|uniref:Uncharacterized protein n=1 Tax=Rhodobium gokarnense TaxID=364296 RepID=A0ABT3HF33_9HYPH|nr:hypothetical protein [Rhodobium gokarnense]MCW2308954.1 hypothetical protein [Rhodobium gokarnense]
MIGLAVVFGIASQALADDGIKWEKILDIPKGQGAPDGVRLDLLGIEIGDRFEDAKAKLERIVADLPDGAYGNIRVHTTRFKLPTGGGSFVETSYPSMIAAQIHRFPEHRTEEINVYMSAPSSGAQVYGILRAISYLDKTVEPKISELLPRLREKFGTDPLTPYNNHGSNSYFYVFDDGAPVKLSDNDILLTGCGYIKPQMAFTERDIEAINRKGNCDIALRVHVDYGLSDDHARTLAFSLFDAARSKANHQADFKFFDDYVNRLRQSGGQGPKL